MKNIYKNLSEIVVFIVLFSYIFVVYSVSANNFVCSAQDCVCSNHKEIHQSCDQHQNNSHPVKPHFSSQTKHIPGMKHFCSCDDLTTAGYSSEVYIQSQENKDSHKHNSAFEDNRFVLYSAPDISAEFHLSKDISPYNMIAQSIPTVVILI